MVGIYHESDERLDVFPASNHIVLVIIFFGIDQFESSLKFFLGNVIDEMYDIFRIACLYCFFSLGNYWTFVKTRSFDPCTS
jgi:hypothetical protein